MGFSQENGYVPSDIETLMNSIRTNVNSQFGTSYTAETFVGSNHYKYFYTLIQRLQEQDVKTSEIFIYLQQYFAITNERINRPSPTPNGIIERLESILNDDDEQKYIASIKKMVEADAGKISICVDADDGEHAAGIATINSFANLVSGTDDSISVAGTAFTAQTGSVTPGGATFQAATSNSATATSLAAQINAHATVSLVVRARAVGNVVHIRAIHGGTAGNAIALAYTDNDTNVGATVSGAFLAGGTASATYADDRLEICETIKGCVAGGIVSQGTESETLALSNGQSFDFKFYLPYKIPIFLRLTTVLSENNEVEVLSQDDQKLLLLQKIAAKYKLGKNFEPQTYITVIDFPWAASILLEWSYDDSTYFSSIYDSNFDDLFEFDIGDVDLVES